MLIIFETSEKPLKLMIDFHVLAAYKVKYIKKKHPSSSLFQQ